MTETTVPPPEHDYRSRHWVRHPILGAHMARWSDRGHWEIGGENRTPVEMHDSCWSYVEPVLEPNEIAALRSRVAELEAAVVHLKGLAPAWKLVQAGYPDNFSASLVPTPAPPAEAARGGEP